MITIKKNKDIPLDIPHFACDENAVGKHLNDHPLTELMNVYGFLCAIGRPGSGKTSLLKSMLGALFLEEGTIHKYGKYKALC
jgi:ABC-type polysaccharide/polyol phosphate transport system ATPase subunit